MNTEHVATCESKCKHETKRFVKYEDDTSLLFMYRNWAAKKDVEQEIERCMNFCMGYAKSCANEPTGARVDECANAKKRWANYLFVTRNRPVEIKVPGMTDKRDISKRRGAAETGMPPDDTKSDSEKVKNAMNEPSKAMREFLRSER